MSKAVVTGGAGFIGSHLAEELANLGSQVIIIDDLSTGKMENIVPLLNEHDVDFVEGSIADLALLQKLFRSAQYVFHQAALPSVPRSIRDPLASNDVNVNGTLNVLLAARDNDVSKVICASSSSVYGDTPTLPKNESMALNPKSPYAVTKVAGEYYCRVFHEVYGLPTVSLRYFNVYGPRQDPTSEYAAVIPKFVVSVSQGRSPTIFGDGEQSRDFTFVKDVVQANILVANGDATGAFNVGRGERVSINQLAWLVIELMEGNVKPAYEQSRLGDVKHSLSDISRASTFGYNPKYNLEDGLKEIIRRAKG